MDKKQYKVAINVRAELVYYVQEYDIDRAIELAIEAPYKEWEVSYYDMPSGDQVSAEEI